MRATPLPVIAKCLIAPTELDEMRACGMILAFSPSVETRFQVAMLVASCSGAMTRQS